MCYWKGNALNYKLWSVLGCGGFYPVALCIYNVAAVS